VLPFVHVELWLRKDCFLVVLSIILVLVGAKKDDDVIALFTDIHTALSAQAPDTFSKVLSMPYKHVIS